MVIIYIVGYIPQYITIHKRSYRVFKKGQNVFGFIYPISRSMKATKMFLIWLERRDLQAHSEYREGSVQLMVTKIFVEQYGISKSDDLFQIIFNR